MFSDTQRVGESKLGVRETATWNLLMSLGFPAFFKQFWFHFKKNFNWNLKKEIQRKLDNQLRLKHLDKIANCLGVAMAGPVGHKWPTYIL